MPVHTDGPTPPPGHSTPVIEIGGTHVTAALVDTATRRIQQDSVRSTGLDGDAPAEKVLASILRCARALGDVPGARWGVAVPGPFDYARGIARFTGVGKFDALHGTDVRHALSSGLHTPARRFHFLNDAHAFTLGEWWAGAAQGRHRVVGITLGTGVGSTFMTDGTLVEHGPTVPPLGHVYLLTVAGRPLEETVSRRAIISRHMERATLLGTSATAGLDVRDIAALARAGDEAAQLTFQETFHALGVTLADWLIRFRADTLVIGGAISHAWDLVATPLHAGLEHSGVGPGIVLRQALQPVRAALLGAARHAESAVPHSTGTDTEEG